MKIGLLGTSYKTAAVEKREKLAIPDARVSELSEVLKAETGIKEVIVLSTCNRVEIYFSADNPLQAISLVEEKFLFFQGLGDDFKSVFYQKIDKEAIKHLFRVSASLDSMVIGEPQILGQVKQAYQLAEEIQSSGFLLNKLFTKAFSVSKRVRNETGIARFAVSISFAAVELSKRIFDTLKDKNILIVGAGEMAELAATHLLKAGCSQLLVTNRTFSRAMSLAEKFKGSAVRFEEMELNLNQADIIISSTGAKDFVITSDMVKNSIKKRKNRPMFFIDIAVPRDIDPKIHEIYNSYVYDIDDLQTVVNNNLKERELEAEKAEAIIEEEIGLFQQWISTLDVVPTIKALRDTISSIAQAELNKGLSELNDISSKQEQAIKSMVNRITNKILHQPTVKLRETSRSEDGGIEYVEVINQLFQLKQAGEKKINSSKIVHLK